MLTIYPSYNHIYLVDCKVKFNTFANFFIGICDVSGIWLSKHCFISGSRISFTYFTQVLQDNVVSYLM